MWMRQSVDKSTCKRVRAVGGGVGSPREPNTQGSAVYGCLRQEEFRKTTHRQQRELSLPTRREQRARRAPRKEGVVFPGEGTGQGPNPRCQQPCRPLSQRPKANAKVLELVRLLHVSPPDFAHQMASHRRSATLPQTRHSQGAVIATAGAAPNTGYLAWVVPRQVAAGMYHFVIRPLTGQRRFEVRAGRIG